MSKGPELFFNIGKTARDLLTKDFNTDQKFSISTFSDSGLALTSSALKRGGISIGDVAGVYKYKNTLFSFIVDSESNIASTVTFDEIFPSTRAIASFKLPDYNSGKLEVQYFHDHATFTTALALNKSPAIDFSSTFGTKAFAFGAEAGYDTTSGKLTKYTAGFTMTKADSTYSIILGDKADTIKAACAKYLDQSKRSAFVTEVSRKFSTNENGYAFGGSYALDPLTTVKAKINNNGKLGAVLQHEMIPKSLLTVSGEFDTVSSERPKIGFAFAIKP
ncbi:mitochondrial outer membrane protein porin 2-like [Mercurialis annua]|uniref:mitochondrial outer membrane protein porin 2-like n=1 Tax=Mercurialis annua TaxID=3986 RepID=UPI002160017C|nr:mitochondrial outer membrane protein porin 2-like [Mercurialis annua]